MKNLCFVLLLSLLAACTSGGNSLMNSFLTSESKFTEITQLTAQLRTEQIKPLSVNDLPFQMVSLDSNNKIEITADSPIVSFPEGNSFVAALLLPEHINRFTFALESDAGRTVFVPSVLFLNEEFQQVAHIDNAQFNRKGYFSIEKVFTEEVAQSIRYILVYSKDSVLDGKTELVDPIREYELKKGKELSETSFPKLYSKHSPVGHLDIRFKDLFFSAQAVTNGLVTESTKEKKAMTLKAAPVVKVPAILSDTEEFYLQQISKAVKAGDNARALSLVEEAERAGSIKAEAHYRKAREKQQQ